MSDDKQQPANPGGDGDPQRCDTGSGGDDKTDRRDFLRCGALMGAASMLGLATGCGGDDHSGHSAGGDQPAGPDGESSGEVVRLFDEDGRLVEVVEDDICHVGEVVSDDEQVRRGIEGKSFVMVIDLASCRNARRCVEQCQVAHQLPQHQEYVRVNKMGDTDDPQSHNYWKPQLCFQCDNPPCTKVCPVDATFKRDDGIVGIDVNQCIGCRFCMAACPYNARVFNWDEPISQETIDEDIHSPETSLPRQRGTAGKCDFCPDMVRDGKLPHCVTACPNGVFYFGDRNEDVVTNGDRTVRLSDLLQENGGYRYLEQLGTEPRVYYLPARNKQFPFERGMENYEEQQQNMEQFRLNEPQAPTDSSSDTEDEQ